MVKFSDRFLKFDLIFYTCVLYTFCVYGPMAVMSIGAAICAIVFFYVLFAYRTSEHKNDVNYFCYKQNPIFIVTVFFSFACVASLVWASVSHLTFMDESPHINWIQDTRKVWHLYFPFLLAYLFSKLPDHDLKKITKLWMILGFASAILGIVQYYIPVYHPLEIPHSFHRPLSMQNDFFSFLRGRYHATGMTGWHLSYASILGFPTTVWLALLAIRFRRTGFDRMSKIGVLIVTIFFTANLLTYSKITWVALPLSVLLILLVGFKGRMRLFLVLVVMCLSFAWGTSSEVRLRFAQGAGTIEERFEVWSANIEMIKQFPILGVGWHHNSELSRAYYQKLGHGSFESHAHNNILDQWSTTGLLGLLGFLWWSLMLFLLSYRIYKNNHSLLWRSIGLGLIGGWLSLHLNGLTQCNFWDAKVLHQIGWVSALTLDVYRRTLTSKL